MLNSRFLLSKKGHLGTIWVAAHCHKRLKKDQVKRTDISSSVDSILQDAIPAFTYRIIAYLLLGVVRIFSKQVDFLFNDCWNARDSLRHLAGIKGVGKSSENNHSFTHSISIPKRFELDAFDLEILEDQDINGCHIVAREEIMLADTWKKEGVEWTNKKHPRDEFLSLEAYSSIHTPVRDVFSPHYMDIDADVTTSRVLSNFESGMERFRGIKFSLEEQLEPMIFGEGEDDFGFEMLSNEENECIVQRIKNPDAGKAAKQLKLLDANQTMNRELERESGINGPSIDGHESDGDQLMNPDTGKPTELVDLLDEEQSVEKLLQAIVQQIQNPDAGKAAEQFKFLDENQTMNHELERESGIIGPSIDGHESDGDQLMNPDTGKPTELVDLLDEEQSMEKLVKATSLFEETMRPMSFSELGKESTVCFPSSLECQNDVEQRKCSGTGLSLKLPEIVRSLDRELNVDSEETRLLKTSPLPNQISAKHPIPITINASPDSKSQGAIPADIVAVRTPSIKERARVKKRKCLCDETVVLPNNVLKHWIGNSNDLVCKRRKAPLTAFRSWQACKISNLPKSFLEPLIPCNPVAFESLISKKKCIIQEPVESLEVHLTEIITQTPVNQVVVESPVKEKSREETPIAPTTPITHPRGVSRPDRLDQASSSGSSSFRLHEVGGPSKPDRLDQASSSRTMEKRELPPNEDPDLVASLMMDEDISSSAGDTDENQKCSVRTRKVAKCLHAKLQHQRKQNGETFMNLMHVFRGKTKKESARLFYEILVLKTGDYIDVKQEHGFGDIVVMGSSKLQEIIDTDSVPSRA